MSVRLLSLSLARVDPKWYDCNGIKRATKQSEQALKVEGLKDNATTRQYYGVVSIFYVDINFTAFCPPSSISIHHLPVQSWVVNGGSWCVMLSFAIVLYCIDEEQSTISIERKREIFSHDVWKLGFVVRRRKEKERQSLTFSHFTRSMKCFGECDSVKNRKSMLQLIKYISFGYSWD